LLCLTVVLPPWLGRGLGGVGDEEWRGGGGGSFDGREKCIYRGDPFEVLGKKQGWKVWPMYGKVGEGRRKSGREQMSVECARKRIP
jgi:hypothetical protein